MTRRLVGHVEDCVLAGAGRCELGVGAEHAPGAAVALDHAPVHGYGLAEDAGAGQVAGRLGAVPHRVQRADELSAQPVFVDDAHGEVADESDRERHGRAAPERPQREREAQGEEPVADRDDPRGVVGAAVQSPVDVGERRSPPADQQR